MIIKHKDSGRMLKFIMQTNKGIYGVILSKSFNSEGYIAWDGYIAWYPNHTLSNFWLNP